MPLCFLTSAVRALVNPTNLKESRILSGPLPKDKQGWGGIENGFKSAKDPRYLKMRELAPF